MDGIVCLVPHTWTRADGSIRIKIDWNELIGQGQCNVCLYRANIPFGLGPIKKIQVTDNLPELVCSKASVSETWNGETIIKKPCKSLIIVWQWHGFTDNFPVISCFVIHVRVDLSIIIQHIAYCIPNWVLAAIHQAWPPPKRVKYLLWRFWSTHKNRNYGSYTKRMVVNNKYID